MALTQKQKEVYDFIVSYWDKHGLAPTQKEIKDHFDFKYFGSVQRDIRYLEEEGLLTSDWNARRGIRPLSSFSSLVAEENPHSLQLPLLGLVAAGNPLEAISNDTACETITVPSEFVKKGQRYFALRVNGDSMIEDGILPEDVVICRFCGQANNGERVVAVINGEATLKKLAISKKTIELHPANARLRPIIVDPQSDFRITGVVVGLLRSYPH